MPTTATWIRQLPNRLSALRLALAPVCALLMVEQAWRWAAVLFILAALTDACDGTIARLCDARTALGEKLDPLADKALVNLCIIALAAARAVPLWLAALVVLRDMLILAGALVSRLRGYPHRLLPMMLGKISTLLQMALIAAVLLPLAGWMATASLHGWLIAAVTLLSLASGGAYVHSWLRDVPRPASHLPAA